MICHEKRSNIVEGDRRGSTGFNIKFGAKAARLLSKSLYTNEPRAIIRELGTNADDAHKQVGSTEPFHVTLPNSLNPEYSIRDFGTGLTHREFKQVYTTYFESTKTETNDLNGCLGLGCKSPLSYVDAYTVESFIGGRRRVYSIYKNEFGEPNWKLMYREATTEPNGVFIKIPVKPDDIWKFTAEAKFVYFFFQNRPLIKGQEIVFDDNVSVHGKNWKQFTNPVSTGWYAIMANVAYPITEEIIRQSADGKLQSIFRATRDKKMCIYFNNGELDFDIGRERLSTDNRTIAMVTKTVSSIAQEYIDSAQTVVDKCKNYYEAVRCVRKSFQHIDNHLTFKGKKIEYTVNTVIHTNFYYPNGSKLKHNTGKTQFDRTQLTNVYYQDGKTIPQKNLRNAIYGGIHDGEYVYIVTDATKVQEFADKVGMDVADIKPASSLPDSPKMERKPAKYKVWVAKGPYYTPVEQEVVFEDGKTYNLVVAVFGLREFEVGKDKKIDNRSFNELIKAIKPTETIYITSRKNSDSMVKKYPNIKFVPYLENVKKELTAEIAKYDSDMPKYNTLRTQYALFRYQDTIKRIGNPVFDELNELYDSIKMESKLYEKMQELVCKCILMRVQISEKNMEETVKKVKNWLDKHPFLCYILQTNITSAAVIAEFNQIVKQETD